MKDFVRRHTSSTSTEFLAVPRRWVGKGARERDEEPTTSEQISSTSGNLSNLGQVGRFAQPRIERIDRESTVSTLLSKNRPPPAYRTFRNRPCSYAEKYNKNARESYSRGFAHIFESRNGGGTKWSVQKLRENSSLNIIVRNA